MANPDHLDLLRQGVSAWNAWKSAYHERADLSGADLSGTFLDFVDFSGDDLRGCNLEDAQMMGANLNCAKLEGCTLPTRLTASQFGSAELEGHDLSGRNLEEASFSGAMLDGANLSGGTLDGASFFAADLRDVDFRHAGLMGTDFSHADLSGADFRYCHLGMTVFSETELARARLDETDLDGSLFANVDLSHVEGLAGSRHQGPSSIGTDTLERTMRSLQKADPERRDIVLAFFRGAGVAEHLVRHFEAPSEAKPDFHPAYIRCLREDEDAAKKLHDELQARGVRCWLRSRSGYEDASPILQGSHWHGERLILVASEAALKTEWVRNEIGAAITAATRGRDGFLVVDVDGCLRDGALDTHGPWLKQRVAADLRQLDNGEELDLKSEVEKLVDRLRA